MPVDSNYLQDVELIRVPFDANTITSAHVRATMFAWCGFARACRVMAKDVACEAKGCDGSCEAAVRSRRYGSMAYEALDRLTAASRLADRLDAIERDTAGDAEAEAMWMEIGDAGKVLA